MSKIVLLKNLTSLQTPKESVEARPTTVQLATVSRMAGRAAHVELAGEERRTGFEHRDGRGEGRNDETDVEHDGEELAERHLREDGGHRHEGEAGAGARVKTEGEDGGGAPSDRRESRT